MTAVCSDCSSPLADNPRRKGTRCRGCNSRHRQSSLSPAERAAIGERCRAAWDRPGHRERMSSVLSAGQRKRLADPVERARVQEICRRAQATNRPRSAEARAKISAAKTEMYLGWCPVDYRPLYRSLARTSRLGAAAARAAVLEQIEVDLARMDAELSAHIVNGRVQQAASLRARLEALRAFVSKSAGGE